MGAERARAVAQPFHDLGDRDDRGVAGEDGLRPDVAFDLDEQLLLQRQIFEHGLDHIVGIAHGVGEVGGRPHALDRGRIVAEIAQIGRGCAIFDACRAFDRDGVIDRHVMAGEREHLGDAVAHQAGADDGDARFRHGHPAV